VERKKEKSDTPLITLISHDCGRTKQKNTKLFEENDATAIMTRSRLTTAHHLYMRGLNNLSE